MLYGILTCIGIKKSATMFLNIKKFLVLNSGVTFENSVDIYWNYRCVSNFDDHSNVDVDAVADHLPISQTKC